MSGGVEIGGPDEADLRVRTEAGEPETRVDIDDRRGAELRQTESERYRQAAAEKQRKADGYQAEADAYIEKARKHENTDYYGNADKPNPNSEAARNAR